MVCTLLSGAPWLENIVVQGRRKQYFSGDAGSHIHGNFYLQACKAFASVCKHATLGGSRGMPPSSRRKF